MYTGNHQIGGTSQPESGCCQGCGKQHAIVHTRNREIKGPAQPSAGVVTGVASGPPHANRDWADGQCFAAFIRGMLPALDSP